MESPSQSRLPMVTFAMLLAALSMGTLSGCGGDPPGASVSAKPMERCEPGMRWSDEGALLGESLGFAACSRECQASSRGALRAGSEVVLVGLQRDTQFNGRKGRLKSFDASDGTWGVEVGGTKYQLRPENLRPAESSGCQKFSHFASGECYEASAASAKVPVDSNMTLACEVGFGSHLLTTARTTAITTTADSTNASQATTTAALAMLATTTRTDISAASQATTTALVTLTTQNTTTVATTTATTTTETTITVTTTTAYECGWEDLATFATRGRCTDTEMCKQFTLHVALSKQDCSEDSDYDLEAMPELGPKSWCAKAFQMRGIMSRFFVVNLADMLLVGLALVPLALLVTSDWEKTPGKRQLAVAGIGMLFVADLVLQIWSLVLAFSGVDATAEALLEAECLNREGDRNLVEFREGLKVLRTLGFVELFISFVGLGLDLASAVDAPGREMVLVLEVLAWVLDFALSILEFAKFTLDNKQKAELMFGSLQQSTDTNASGMEWCVDVVPELTMVEFCKTGGTLPVQV